MIAASQKAMTFSHSVFLSYFSLCALGSPVYQDQANSQEGLEKPPHLVILSLYKPKKKPLHLIAPALDVDKPVAKDYCQMLFSSIQLLLYEFLC